MSDPEVDKMAHEAIRAHGRWKLTLVSAMASGELPKPVHEIRRDDCCDFGKWLLKEADHPRSRACASFNKLRRQHRHFHQVAGEVAALIDRGDTSAAEAKLHSADYRNATDDLRNAVVEWKSRH